MFYGATPDIFKLAERLRKNVTPEEEFMWFFLKENFGEYKFRRQHPAGPFVLDFYCHRLKIPIEIDGGYHLQLNQRRRDNEREDEIRSWGVDVIRFTNEQVKREPEKIRMALTIRFSLD